MSKINTETKKKWYIVRVDPRFEGQVTKNLKERILAEGLTEQFGDIVSPTEKVIDFRKGKRKEVEQKFLRGYLFVNMEINEHTRHLIHKIPNVWGFLGGNNPTPLKDSDVSNVFDKIHSTASNPRPNVSFQPGQQIKIISGAFEGFPGTIESVDYEKKKCLYVSVMAFQRSISLELKFDEVKAV